MNFASASTNKRDTRMFLASEGRVAFLPHPGGMSSQPDASPIAKSTASSGALGSPHHWRDFEIATSLLGLTIHMI